MGFQQIVAILDDAVGGRNAGVARHGPFWRNITQDVCSGSFYPV